MVPLLHQLRFRLMAGVLVAFSVLLCGTPTYANTILFANLTNNQENPPTNPTLTTGASRPVSYGMAVFDLNTAMTAMSFAAMIFNIDVTGSQTTDVNDNLTAAHIHAATVVLPTNNVGVVWGFFGSPLNDNNPNDVVVTPFANGVGGTISGKWDLTEGNNTTLTLQLPNILSGNSYINFHTTQFGSGEIRGAIVATPEPSSALLLLTGVVGLAGLCAQRRARFGKLPGMRASLRQ